MGNSFKVSKQHRVTLGKTVCEQVGIKPGDFVTFIVKHGSITLVPVLSIDELAERLHGMNIEGYRDERDRY